MPITDDSMIKQMVEHFAESGIVNTSRQKQERYITDYPGNEGDWKEAKKWHRTELKMVWDAGEDAGLEKGAASQAKKSEGDLEERVKQEIRQECSGKGRDSLNSIAAVTTVSHGLLDRSSQSMKSLTATNAR